MTINSGYYSSTAIKPKIDKQSEMYKISVEFEALFIKEMLKAMRKTVNKSSLINTGLSGEIFEDMLYDEYAKNMAQRAGFGLAETLYRQLSPSA